MQGPTFYSGQPMSAQQGTTNGLWSRLFPLFLSLCVIVLISGGLYGLQWVSQRAIDLGYPLPQVHITTAQSSLMLHQTYQCSASASGRDLTYSWDFGDGSYDSGPSVSHTYQSNGTFTITVTVIDGIHHRTTDTTSVRVIPPPPTAVFSFSYSYYRGDIYFDASSSTVDPSTRIARYNWDFGDGQHDSTTYYQESHQYLYTGTYTVTLTVTDDTGQTSNPQTATVVIS